MQFNKSKDRESIKIETVELGDGTCVEVSEKFKHVLCDDVRIGDEVKSGDYTYKYGYNYLPFIGKWEECVDTENLGWGVRVNNVEKDSYGEIKSALFGKPVTCLDCTFTCCRLMTESPVIPDSVITMVNTYGVCTSLSVAPLIPASVKNMAMTFVNCESLKVPPVIPDGVLKLNRAFYKCTSLLSFPVIPASVENLEMTFKDCINVSGDIFINANPTLHYKGCFAGTERKIILKGNSFMLDKFTAMSSNENIEISPEAKNIVNDDYLGINIPAGPLIGRIKVIEGNKADMENGILVPGDMLEYGDYIYCYKNQYDYVHSVWGPSLPEIDGWGVRAKENKPLYEPLCGMICGKPVTSLFGTFAYCDKMQAAPDIPVSVVDLTGTFYNCASLKEMPLIPRNVRFMFSTFCLCTSLSETSDIPENVEAMFCTFMECNSLTGRMVIDADPVIYTGCFDGTKRRIKLTGLSNSLWQLADTSEHKNIKIRLFA